jgi:hypothetical protein
MKINVLYKHVNNTDVSFMPYQIKEEDDALLIRGGWFNIVNESDAFLIETDEIKILKKDLPKWKRLDE